MRRSLILSIALLMICCFANARTVKGTVTSGEEKLKGVIVTDGKHFTQTKKNGKFKFRIEDGAEYIYVMAPSGYMADAPESRLQAEGNRKFMFNLHKSDVGAWTAPELMEKGRHAFFAGKDAVIVLDDAKAHLDWVSALEAVLPADSDVYVLLPDSFEYSNTGRVIGTVSLTEALRNRKVTFISAMAAEDAPQGHRVLAMRGGRLEWYYQTEGKPENYQFEIFNLGRTLKHPNSVVVDIWDWNPSWKTEWFEDGKSMGRLRPAELGSHVFAATPGQYSKNVTIAVEDPFGKKWVHDVDVTDYIDVQAHRGGAGHMPENTIEAMKHALDMGVNTLELDLHVSADGQVVVSHDPYFHHRYATRPDGTPVKPEDPKEYIYRMPYSEVAKYDVGSRPNQVWPEQANIKTVKPLAGDLIDFVENYTKEMGYSPVRYNIEIKSVKGVGEGQNWPTYDEFATICCKFLNSKYLDDRLVVQSFDVRALNYIHEKYPELILSYLVDTDIPEFEDYMKLLKFTPQWLSPHYSIVDEELVKTCREKGIKLVPWTVDRPEDIKRMIDLGVDAIISNYPDRVLLQTRGF